MRIELKSQSTAQRSCTNLSFKAAYLDLRSLQNYGKGKDKLVQALKDRNIPLRRFLNETLNNIETEKKLGDVFVGFERTRLPYEGEDFFDTSVFSFPKIKEKRLNQVMNKFYKFFTKDEDKNYLKETIAKETDYLCAFRDYDYRNSAQTTIGSGFQNGTEQLVKYLGGNEIVENLKKHIELILK